MIRLPLGISLIANKPRPVADRLTAKVRSASLIVRNLVIGYVKQTVQFA